MSTSLRFTPTPASTAAHTLVVGPRTLLDPKNVTSLAPDASSIASVVASGRDKTARTWTGSDSATSTTIAALEEPTQKSRWLGNVRGDLLQKVVQTNTHAKDDVHIHVLLQAKDQALSVTNAIARSFPLFSAKTPAPGSRSVSVSLSTTSEGKAVPLSEDAHSSLTTFADAIRQTARLVDTPTSELNTTALVKEIQAVADTFPETVKAEIISGEALLPAGLRALHGVGRAATAPPALASLSYTPASGSNSHAKVALVGKGIVYDTGGLSLKSGANMCEMKSDMGGCAALLQAFRVLVESKCPIPVVFVGCVAENAIGPLAQRPDDIVVAHSGKTIELNNTDAEGRLVLADGVSWVAQTHKPTHIVDMATLTGAQMITTGMYHAAVLSSSPSLEATLLAAGQQSGDWAFPMIYAPEILMSEFDSKVADMKNSVKSRLNAQSSCAGHFIEAHLPESWKGEWAHVDIAGPSLRDGRATGFGVGMIVEAVRTLAKGTSQ